MKYYFYNLFVAINLVGAAIFGAGMYESTCACAWRMRHYKGLKGFWSRKVIWVTNAFQDEHCMRCAYAYNRLKQTAPRI